MTKNSTWVSLLLVLNTILVSFASDKSTGLIGGYILIAAFFICRSLEQERRP